METKEDKKKEVHTVIKYLPEDVPPFSIVGSGDYAVCINTGELKHLPSSPKTWKIVKLLTTERDEETIIEINRRKAELYHKGVHVALSSNVKRVQRWQKDTNPHIEQAIKNYNGSIIQDPYIRYLSMYDEAFLPGEPFKIKEPQQWQKWATIPPQHITKMIFDAYSILDAGFTIDYHGDNILYDNKKGFYFIDLGLPDPFSNPSTRLFSMLQKIFYLNTLDITYSTEKNTRDVILLASKVTNAIDLLLKVHPELKESNHPSWKDLSRWNKEVKDIIQYKKDHQSKHFVSELITNATNKDDNLTITD